MRVRVRVRVRVRLRLRVRVRARARARVTELAEQVGQLLGRRVVRDARHLGVGVG